MSTAAVEYISYYRNEIGERKFRKILKEIKTAKRFNYLMKASAEQRTMPGASDFLNSYYNLLDIVLLASKS